MVSGWRGGAPRGFGAVLRSLTDRLRKPGFADAWQLFSDSFTSRSFRPPPRTSCAARADPGQPVVLGFWRQILEEPAAELEATEAVRASGVP